MPHPTDDENPTRSESGSDSPAGAPGAQDTGAQPSQAADTVTSRIRRAFGRDAGHATEQESPAPGESNTPTEGLARTSAADSADGADTADAETEIATEAIPAATRPAGEAVGESPDGGTGGAASGDAAAETGGATETDRAAASGGAADTGDEVDTTVASADSGNRAPGSVRDGTDTPAADADATAPEAGASGTDRSVGTTAARSEPAPGGGTPGARSVDSPDPKAAGSPWDAVTEDVGADSVEAEVGAGDTGPVGTTAAGDDGSAAGAANPGRDAGEDKGHTGVTTEGSGVSSADTNVEADDSTSVGGSADAGGVDPAAVEADAVTEANGGVAAAADGAGSSGAEADDSGESDRAESGDEQAAGPAGVVAEGAAAESGGGAGTDTDTSGAAVDPAARAAGAAGGKAGPSDAEAGGGRAESDSAQTEPDVETSTGGTSAAADTAAEDAEDAEDAEGARSAVTGARESPGAGPATGDETSAAAGTASGDDEISPETSPAAGVDSADAGPAAGAAGPADVSPGAGGAASSGADVDGEADSAEANPDGGQDDAPAETDSDTGEARTVVLRRQHRPDEARTVSLPTQQPDADATERIDMNEVRRKGQAQRGGQAPARTDRVGPGVQGLSKPPSTPRPQSGPKGPGPQTPGRPDQPASQRPGGPPPPRPPGRPQSASPHPGPLRPGAPQQAPQQAGPQRAAQQPVPQQQPAPPQQPGGQRPGGAHSPADMKPTAAEQRVGQGQQYSAPPPIARPERVGPAPAEPGNNKKLLVAGAVAVLVVAVAAILLAFGVGTDTPQDRITTAIGDYTGALESGALPALRSATCGGLHDYYQGMSEEQFADVHRQAVDEGSIPEVTGVDAVRITDTTALAQVSVRTGAEPAETTRTFDLEETDSGWKVCDPPAQ